MQSTAQAAKTLMELMMSTLVSNAKLAEFIRKRLKKLALIIAKTQDKDADNISIFTADMQIILLSKMTLKKHFFVSRLIFFNETFASVNEDGDFLGRGCLR